MISSRLYYAICGLLFDLLFVNKSQDLFGVPLLDWDWKSCSKTMTSGAEKWVEDRLIDWLSCYEELQNPSSAFGP